MAMSSAELQVVLKARDEMSAVLKSVASQLGGVDKAAQSAAKGASGLSSVFSGITGVVGGAVKSLGALGLAAQGVEVLAGAARGAGEALGVGLASEAENVRAKFKAFIPDAGVLEKTLADVRKEADLTPFGFRELSAAVAGLIPSAKQAKEPLIDLTRTAEILAASHPEQGLEGAAFALREAVSGDFTSVIERFDLPRTTINKLKAEGVPALEIVRKAMGEMGYSMDLVANLAATTTGRFSTFQDALDGLKLKAGEPILAAFGEQLDALSGFLADNQEALAGFASMVGNTMAQVVSVGAHAVGDFIATVRTLAPAFQDVVHAIGNLIDGDFEGAMGDLRNAAQVAVDFLNQQFGGAVSDLQSTFSAFTPTANRFGEAFGVIGDFIENNAIPALSNMQQGAATLLDAMGGGQRILNDFAGGVNTVTGALSGLQPIASATGQVLGGLGTATSEASDAYGKFLVQQGLVSAATAEMQGPAKGTAAVIDALWAVLANTPVGKVVESFKAIVGAIQSAQAHTGDAATAMDKAWQEMIAFTGNLRDQIAAKLKEVGAAIAALPGQFREDAVKAGASIVEGMIAGLNPARLVVAVAGMTASAIAAARAALDSHSPSKVFEDIGESMPEGLIQGVEGMTDDLIGAVEDMLSQVRQTAETMGEDAFASVATAMGAAFEKTFTIVEEAQNKIDNARADLDRRYQRDGELEEVKYQRRLADLRADAATGTVAQKKAANEAIQALQQAHGNKLVDLEQSYLDKISEMEFDAADQLAAASERQALARGRALQDFVRDAGELTADVASKAEAIGQKAADAIAEAMKDAGKSIQDVKDKAAQAISDLQDNQTASRDVRALRATFATGQDDESRQRDQKQEDADLEYKLSRDLAKAKLKLGKDQAKATTDDEHRQLDIRYADEVQNLKDGFEEAKKDLARRRSIEEDNRKFRADQAKALQDFNDNLEDKALLKQMERLHKDAETRIAEINRALGEKTAAINKQEGEEREALRKSADEKLADLKTRFYDKAGKLNDDSKTAFETLFQAIAGGARDAAGAVSDLASVINKVSGAKPGAGAASGGKAAADGQTFGAQSSDVQSMFLTAYGSRAAAEEAWIAQHEYELDLGNLGKPPKVVNGVDMGPYNGEAGQSWYSYPEESGSNAGDHFAEGGIVPGPVGMARAATVHGGEGVFTPDQMAALGSLGRSSGGSSFGGGAAGTTIILQVSGNTLLGDDDRMAEKLAAIVANSFAQNESILRRFSPHMQGAIETNVRLKMG